MLALCEYMLRCRRKFPEYATDPTMVLLKKTVKTARALFCKCKLSIRGGGSDQEMITAAEIFIRKGSELGS